MSEEWLRETSRPIRAPEVDSSAPNVARVWNVLMGGRDNFEADRRAARQLVAASPVIAQAPPASRAFHRRAVGYLVAEAGIRQFIDIGIGLPVAAASTHEVAQAADPSCRAVYVDNDPVVLAHARARLGSLSESGTSHLDLDARDTAAIVAGASRTLDLARPVGIIMIHLLNFIADAADVVARLVAELAAGSHLAVTHPAEDERFTAGARQWNRLAMSPVYLRGPLQVRALLSGLELIDPGVVELHKWRPAPGDPHYPDGLPVLGAVARKP
jgi:hypothetical protein